MKRIEDYLRTFFAYPSDFNLNYKQAIDDYYKSQRTRHRVLSSDFEGRCGMITDDEKRGKDYWIYTADKIINKKADKKAKTPLTTMDDCEYMYYGMLLNCYATIDAPRKTGRLIMVNAVSGETYHYRYRKDLAELILNSVNEQYNSN